MTEQLFDAALGELGVVALREGGGCYDWLGTSTWRTHQNPLPGKRDFGWALGSIWKSAWAFACPVCPLLVTCKRAWGASGGHRRDFMVGCPLAAAAVVLAEFCPTGIGGLVPHLAVWACF